MIRLYVIGIAILLVAILANGIAIKLGFKTWYDFLGLLNQNGIRGIKILGSGDYIWLFIIYPLCLGIAYWLGDKIYKLI
jgi:hypothetical protein